MGDLPSAHPEIANDETESDTLDGPVELDKTADDFVGAGEKPDPINDFLRFEEYRVNSTVIDRPRTIIYQQSNENLFQRENISYLGCVWELRFSWHNRLDTEHTYSRTVQEGLTIREGQETERNFGVSASFKGLGIDAGGTRKTFSDRETSSLVTIEKVVTIPAGGSVFFYQKRYNFSTTAWWGQHVPGWVEHNHFTVGVNGGGQTIQRTARTWIYAEEYASLPDELTGFTTITAERAPERTDEPPVRRQFVNITAAAKRWLQDRGVTGAG